MRRLPRGSLLSLGRLWFLSNPKADPVRASSVTCGGCHFTFACLEENFVYLLALKSGEGAKLVDRDERMVLLAGRSFDLHEQLAAKALGSS
jgi:hypothetical protein